MKFYNIVFRGFLLMMLISGAKVLVGNTDGVKNNKTDFWGYKIEEDSKGENFTKLEKKFGDDDVELDAIAKELNRDFRNINNQQRISIVNLAESSKPQLFLLYSSLKIDC